MIASMRGVEVRPLRVGRVGAVVDDGRSLASTRRVRGLGDVRDHDLNPDGEVGSPPSIRGSHPVTPRGEVTGDGEAERTGPKDHMEASLCHRFCPRSPRRPFAQRGDVLHHMDVPERR